MIRISTSMHLILTLGAVTAIVAATAPVEICSEAVRALEADTSDDHAVSQSLMQKKMSLHLERTNAAVQRIASNDYWPSARGLVSAYTVSPHSAPKKLSNRSLAWSWHHPDGKWATIPVGTAIDGGKNVYLTAADGLRKFSPDGNLLWYNDYRRGEIIDAASLWNGAAYVSSGGHVLALSMETGEALWESEAAPSMDGNNGFVSAYDGVVIVGADAQPIYMSDGSPGCCGDGNTKVVGLSASNGTKLWEYMPLRPIWNFLALFGDDQTFVFQDIEGRAYRNRLSDGTNIWNSGGLTDTWTDGGALLGHNGIVYTVSTTGNGASLIDLLNGGSSGYIFAFNFSSGQEIWRRRVPKPPNNAPAIGRLVGTTGLSIVQPVGQQCQQGMKVEVHTFDAATGKPQWTFDGGGSFVQSGSFVAGDFEGESDRLEHGLRGMTMPNPWGAPSVDKNGVVFVGSETGHFVSLQDANADGVVNGMDEVSDFYTGAASVGCSAPALAPGMVAMADISTLYVFKD